MSLRKKNAVILEEDDRGEIPITRPDTASMLCKPMCFCDVCRRPESRKWKQKALKLRVAGQPIPDL